MKVLTKEIARDTIKNNVQVLTIAAKDLGLRVGVKTCQVHVEALYTLMSINCPGRLFYFLDQAILICCSYIYGFSSLPRAILFIHFGWTTYQALPKDTLQRHKAGS